MRTSKDIYKTKTGEIVSVGGMEETPKEAKLLNGYDYKNQAWVISGRYVACGHPEAMNCRCYGKIHEGEQVI